MNHLHRVVPCITLAAFCSLALAAQQASTAPTTLEAAASVPVPSTANVPEATNPQLRPVTGELVTKIDTKKAKIGDQVVVKTTEKATIADGVVIPKGSRILGHVTEVQEHTKQSPNSRVTLQFDKAELKGGKTLPIKSVLQSVAPAAGMAAAGGVDPFGTGAPGATGATSGGSPSGAGSPSSPGMAPTQPTQTQGSTAAMMNDNNAANSGPRPGTVISTQGNVVIKTTGIPGVLIATNANGQPFSNASGALLGARQNVQLDGGTKMTLAIADSPAQNPH